MSNALTKLKNYQKIRSQTVFCPVIRKEIIVSPLTVGDDLHIRTMIVSPERYDDELSKMIFDHMVVPGVDNLEFKDFISNVSQFDKKYLLWGIFSSTYAKISDVEVECPSCDEIFKTTIEADDLIHEETITMWAEDKSFSEFIIEVDYDITDTLKLRFYMLIPSIKKHLDTLQSISADKMRSNFESFNSIMSKTDELLLITSYADLIETKEAVRDEDGKLGKPVVEVDTIKSSSELHALFNAYVPLDAEEILVDKYNTYFEKYNPVFINKCKCPECEHDFEFPVDIEMALFKRFLRE